MRWLILLLLLLPLVSAYDVDIILNANDIASEHFSIRVPSDYDSYDFYVPYAPVSIIYDGRYSVLEDRITFYNDGEETLNFTLIYGDMIDSTGQGKTFRAEFDNSDRITLSLPPKYILSKEPSTVPSPTYMTSDGEHIILVWYNISTIAVFYEGEQNSIIPILIIAFIALAFISGLFYYYSKRKVHSKINELLSDDENNIIAELKKGVAKQKDIARNLGFSKSKMSKVIRKLEEKKLIEKKPHFKTNIIKLK